MIRLTAELTPAGTSYLATGQGQPVVLIHGVGLNKEMWGGQIVGHHRLPIREAETAKAHRE